MDYTKSCFFFPGPIHGPFHPEVGSGFFYARIKMQELSVLNSNQKTMSSLEIAELVETRHDVVKKSIERLIQKGIISKPPLVDGEKSANGVVIQLYLLEKRDSFVVVAQLSPKFTAKLVDRWQKLESQQLITLPGNYLEALQALVASETEKEELRLISAGQASQIEHQTEVIKQKDQYVIASNEASIKAGEILVREFCKSVDIVDIGEKQFYQWMRDKGIVSENNEPYGQYVKAGYFTYKPTEERHGGKYRYTMRITPRGKVWLAAKYLLHIDTQDA